ncbi:DUF6228 family protein [Antribacter sp. KLBMP9083]|uniref:DUF6228 family protein n=1 Tax=Antribacter soli TaxID=2910976 RepID=A0AA41QJB0_9MICO|nr:DUF6228 family protein [Antribacter soli]MCF4123741.1 DUF6228 family protein [Antribacter soli]
MFLDDADPAVLRIPASTELTLEFEKDFPYGPDDPHIAGVLVRATGNHVRIEQQVILLGTRELPDFLRGLSDDFRGWTGERTWRSLEDELRVTARHDGHVHLRWELTHPYGDAPWTFTTTTRHGAGEDMRSLADAFDELLDPQT